MTKYLELVHCKEHLAHSGAPAWSPQCNSGSGVTFNPRSLRLDAQSRHISENQGNDGAPGGGLVCFSPDQTASPVLQLESRPGSYSDQCQRQIPSCKIGHNSGVTVCQSTVVFDPSALSLQGEDAISTSSVITPFWKT